MNFSKINMYVNIVYTLLFFPFITIAEINNLVTKNVPLIDLEEKGVYYHTRQKGGWRFYFWCRVNHTDGVPEAIKKVYVLYPDGCTFLELPYLPGKSKTEYDGVYEEHFAHNPDWGKQNGIYTFIVIDNNNYVNKVSDFFVLNEIEPIEEKSLLPPTESSVDTFMPTLSWNLTNAYRYQINIYDENFRQIHKGHSQDHLYTLPKGIIKPHSFFRYTVESYSEEKNFDRDNHSRSPASGINSIICYTNFDKLCLSIDLDNTGVASINIDNQLFLFFHVRVCHPLGIADNIKHVHVQTPLDEIFELKLSKLNNINEGIYEIYVQKNNLSSGVYQFSVTDFEGNQESISESFIENSFTLITPQPALSPSNKSILNTNIPTFLWDSIENVFYYKLEIYDSNNNKTGSFITDNSFFTMPIGYLSDIASYSWTITYYREEKNNNINNMYKTPLRVFFVDNLCDFNEDNVVNLSDVNLMKDHWNLRKIDQYKYIYDINRNKMIDVIDIMKVVSKIAY